MKYVLYTDKGCRIFVKTTKLNQIVINVLQESHPARVVFRITTKRSNNYTERRTLPIMHFITTASVGGQKGFKAPSFGCAMEHPLLPIYWQQFAASSLRKSAFNKMFRPLQLVKKNAGRRRCCFKGLYMKLSLTFSTRRK